MPKAYEINAEKQLIQVVMLPLRKSGNQLEAMQRCVGGYIEIAHRFKNKDVCLVDEDGINKDLHFGFTIQGGHQPLYGNGLICRMGDTDVAITLEELKPMVLFWAKTGNGHARNGELACAKRGVGMSVNREAWLMTAIKWHLRKLFKQHAVDLPEIKVSVGLPYGRGGKKAIGQHWAPDASDDKKGSIFISPTIDDSIEVLGVLVHECVHAAVGNEHKHGPRFKEVALKVGLEGKMTHTTPGALLKEKLNAIVFYRGDYPHAKLNLAMRPDKKQTTRLIKMECQFCGYIARASRSAIEDKGPVICPCSIEPMTFSIEEDRE